MADALKSDRPRPDTVVGLLDTPVQGTFVALVAFATLCKPMSVMPKPLTVLGLFLMLAQLGGGALMGMDQPSSVTTLAFDPMDPIALIAPVGTKPAIS